MSLSRMTPNGSFSSILWHIWVKGLLEQQKSGVGLGFVNLKLIGILDRGGSPFRWSHQHVSKHIREELLFQVGIFNQSKITRVHALLKIMYTDKQFFIKKKGNNNNTFLIYGDIKDDSYSKYGLMMDHKHYWKTNYSDRKNTNVPL